MVRTIELLSYPVLPADAAFTELELKKLGGNLYRELLMMYPALKNITQCNIRRRFQSKSGSICMVVELEELPQETLRYSGGRKSVPEDRIQLEDIAQMILASARDGQELIYLQAQRVELDALAFSENVPRDDRYLNALLRQRRGTRVSIDTLMGQDSFDFPDVVECPMLDEPLSLTGLVHWVAGNKFRLTSIRFDKKPNTRYPRLSNRDRKDVLFQREIQDVRELGQIILAAAIDLSRIRMMVLVAVRPLTGDVDHFILHSPSIEVVTRQSTGMGSSARG